MKKRKEKRKEQRRKERAVKSNGGRKPSEKPIFEQADPRQNDMRMASLLKYVDNSFK